MHFRLPKIADGGDVWIFAAGVVAAGKGVEKEDRIAAIGVERAPGFVGEGEFGQFSSIAETEWFVFAEGLKMGFDERHGRWV